jgi:hypothetical protein
MMMMSKGKLRKIRQQDDIGEYLLSKVSEKTKAVMTIIEKPDKYRDKKVSLVTDIVDNMLEHGMLTDDKTLKNI